MLLVVAESERICWLSELQSRWKKKDIINTKYEHMLGDDTRKLEIAWSQIIEFGIKCE